MIEKDLSVAARPCASCPYRKDVPSGIWMKEEYDKLPAYDGDVPDQLMKGAIGVFMCHQRDGNLCAGWLACHGARNLLGMRLQAKHADSKVWGYKTDVPVFGSGAEAREHGMRDIAKPGPKAKRLVSKLVEKGKGK